MWIHYSIEKGVLFSFSGLSTKRRHYTVFHRKDPAFIQEDTEIGKRLVNGF